MRRTKDFISDRPRAQLVRARNFDEAVYRRMAGCLAV